MSRFLEFFSGTGADTNPVSTTNPLPVAATTGVVDSAGTFTYPDRYAQVLTYNADGTLNTIAFTDGTNTWTQTMTYTTGKLTGISKWVKT